MNDSTTFDSATGVAVIGMAGRFPRARNIGEFWRNLRHGVEGISFFSDAELLAAGVDPALLNNPNYVKAAGMLDGFDLFDAAFFGYSPREAETMDPQQRIFLECAWEALENAGYDPEKYSGAIGVYAGISMNEYLWNNLYTNPGLMEAAGAYQVMLGNDKDFVGTRVSYNLNLKGPSLVIQTACSTSLVAISEACQSLLNYQSDMVLAGGVSITLMEKTGYLYQPGGIFSPDGHCRAFDAKARGMLVGNGAGIVVLKRVEEALRDGDRIYAVIKGFALNNDGSLKIGYTAPSVDGQAEVIAMAQALAGVTADTINYIEAHGTGTELGDPIEIAALTKAFRATTDKKGFCAIGSAKTNIGHLDAAAGVAGFIKTVLALAHQEIPPSLYFEKPNPQIDFANSPFYVNTKLAEWKAGATPRRAGVSSFGIGGTNAHVVLEEAPVAEPSGDSRPAQLLLLSAKTATALERATDNLIEHLQQHPDLNLADVAYTLQVGRQDFNYRWMLVCRSLDDAGAALQNRDRKRVLAAAHEPGNRAVTFLFSGQGAQYANMGKELYQTEAVFREHVDRCAEILKTPLELDLRQVIYPKADETEAAEKLKQTYLTQPALFAIEYALAQLWLAWGVRPHSMLGHSIGEYVAACLAGVFSLEDALALVAARGHLMQQMPGGAMLAVSLPEAEVAPLLHGHVSIAAINAPALSVVSGPTPEIDELAAQLAQQSVECRLLHTSHAFHSQMMDEILAPFTALVSRTRLAAPKIPFISNVSGTWITAQEATDPRYWARHLRHTVRFSDGVMELLKEPSRILLEVGPGQTLVTLARMCLTEKKEKKDKTDKADKKKETVQAIIASTRHPMEAQSDLPVLLQALGQLWLAGVRVNWAAFYAGERRHRLPLPSYPFERKRYWVEPRREAPGAPRPSTLAKKPEVNDWFYAPCWRRSVSPTYLKPLAEMSQNSCWLIFNDEEGVGEKIIARLERGQQEVVAVNIGEKFGRRDGHGYVLNPTSREDYEALFMALRAQDLAPQRIVHLWGVTPPDVGLGTADLGLKDFPGPQSAINNPQWEQAQARGFYSLLYLAQALGNAEITNPLHISVVTSDAQNVTGEDLACPEKATVLGICRVLPQEYPGVTCRHIDILSSDAMDTQTELLIEQLVAEFTAQSSDQSVAYRNASRWTQSWQPVYLAGRKNSLPRLRYGGVYLITGGLGGIGLALAEHLAQAVKAKLVLVGRSEMPPKAEWEQWLRAHDEDDGASVKIRQVKKLEALGAAVMVVRADVADPEQMQQIIRHTHERFGQIHGVIHAAGIAGGGILQRKAPETAASVMNPKVKGTLMLAALLKDTPPDFFVLCSSITSLLGGFGQSDYCGANAFLDAFAQRRDRGSVFTVAINWDAWGDVGMAVNTVIPADLAAQRREALKDAITSPEGVEAFSRILGGDLPQVVVSTQDWLKRLELHDAVSFASDQEDASQPSAAPATNAAHSRPELTADYAAPGNEVEKTLAEIWANLFGLAPVGIYDNFFELGGHSLLATRLLSRVRDAFQMTVTLQSFFETPTIAGLAESILEKMVGSEDAEELNRILQEIEAE